MGRERSGNFGSEISINLRERGREGEKKIFWEGEKGKFWENEKQKFLEKEVKEEKEAKMRERDREAKV